MFNNINKKISNYERRHRKRAFLLFTLFVVSTVLSYIPSSFAANASSSYVSEAMAIFNNVRSWEKAGYTYSDNVTAFNTEIDRISSLSGKSAKSAMGKWLNPLVYHEYNGLIVYGNPHAADSSEFLKRDGSFTFRNGVQGEYKYIGYDENDNLITNDHYFPKEPIGRFTTYKEINWSDIPGAEATWGKLHQIQKEYLLNTVFSDDDFKPSGSITQPPLLKSFLEGSSYLTKAYVQTDPGLWRAGSIRLEYKPNHWNTLIYNPMGCTFTGSISADKNLYTIKAGEDSVSVVVNMTISFGSSSYLQHIERVEFVYDGKVVDSIGVKSGITTYSSKKFNVPVIKNNLNTGSNPLNLKGFVRVFSKYEEFKELPVNTYITVNVEESPEPWVEAIMTAEPSLIEFSGSNMPVKLNVTYGIANIKDIKKINSIEVRIKDEGSYFKTPSLVGQHALNVTIPASYMTGFEKREKTYEVEVIYTIDGKTYSKKTAAGVHIVKKTPTKEPIVSASMTAIPSSIKFNNADMPVKLNISYSISNVELSKVRDVNIMVTGIGSFTASAALSGLYTVNTSIPAYYMSGFDTRAKDYEAYIGYNMKDGNTNRAYTTATVNIYREVVPPSPTPSPSPTPTPILNNPPSVRLSAPAAVKVGEVFSVNAYGSDPDGDPLTYDWSYIPAVGTVSERFGQLSYDIAYVNSNQLVEVHVFDGELGAIDQQVIHVLPPTVEARMKITGMLKVNRKVTLTDMSSTPSQYPIVSRVWTVTPVTSTGTSASDIKHSGDWNSITEEVLFKRAGQYKITLYVINSAGYESITEEIISINPDVSPVASASSLTTLIRDPNYSNMVTLEINNLSFSPDWDSINTLRLFRKYDSDNDGNFDAHSWTTVYNGYNQDKIVDTLYEVGKYRYKIEVSEDLGSNTIFDFISADDYGISSYEWEIEVINLAPNITFDIKEKKRVNILFNIGESQHGDKTVIESKLNSLLIPKLNQKNLDFTLNVSVNRDEYASNSLFKDKIYINFFNKVTKNYDFFTYNPKSKAYTFLNISIPMTTGQEYDHHYYSAVTINGNIYTLKKDSANGYYDLYKNGYYVCEAYRMNNNGNPQVLTDSLGNVYIYNHTGIQYYDENTNSLLDVEPYPIYGATWVQEYIRGVKIGTNNKLYVLMEIRNTDTGSRSNVFAEYDWQTKTTYVITSSITASDKFTCAPNGKVYYSNSSASSGISVIEYNPNTKSTKTIDTIDYSYYYTNPASLHSGYNNDVYVYFTSYYTNPIMYKYIIRDDGSVQKETVNNNFFLFDSNTPGWMAMLSPLSFFDVKNNLIYTNITSPDASKYLTTPYYSDYGTDNYAAYNYYILKTPPYSSSLKIEYDKIITSHSWDSKDKNYYVELSDNDISGLDDILYCTLSNNISIVGLGTSSNRTQIENIIARNDGNGTFIYNSNMDTAINQLADYILTQIEQEDNVITKYVLLNEGLEINSYYDDFENDPQLSIRYSYNHDPSYFDNSLGYADNMGVFMTTPLLSFSKPGKYEMNLSVRDNPKNSSYFDNYRLWSYPRNMVLYVHRKPVPIFTVSLTKSGSNYITVYTENSYDLDHTSRPDKGIVQKNWYYREETSTTWIAGKLPSTIPANQTYFVKLEVMDMEYEWASSVQVISSVEKNHKPIAQFYFIKNPVSRYEYSTIANVLVDTSTDPDGDAITERKWTVKKSGVIQSGGINTVLSASGIGNYEVTLEVKDSKNAWSDPYTQILTVVDDTTPPTLYINPTTISWGTGNVTVNMNASDTGGSGLKAIRYLWSNNPDFADGQFSTVYTTGIISSTQASEGVWYLYAQAIDNSGNSSPIVKGGPYCIDKTPPALLDYRVAGEKYRNDKTYWIAQNDFLDVYIKSKEKLSGMLYTYFRLVGGDENRASHDWTGTSTNFNEFVTSTKTDIIAASRTLHDIDNGEYEVMFTLKGLNDTLSSLQYYFTDMAGNSYGYANSGFYLGVDTLAPVINISHEVTDLGNNKRTVTVSVTDTGSGVNHSKYIVTNSATKPGSGAGWITEYNSIFTFEITGTGIWYVFVESIDNVGNIANSQVGPFYIDMDAPLLYADPINRDWGNTDISINLTAVEGFSSLKEVRYSLTKGIDRVYTDWQFASNASQNIVTIADSGVWYLHAEAEDAAGNITYSYWGPYRIDKERPSVSVGYIGGARYISGNNHYIRQGDTVTYWVQGTDNFVGPVGVYILAWDGITNPYRHFYYWGESYQSNYHTYISIGEPTVVINDSRNLRVNFPLNAVSSGDHLFSIHGLSYDRVWNENENGWIFSGYNLITDNTDPSISVDISEGAFFDNVNINISSTDTGSGVKNISYAWSSNTNTPVSGWNTTYTNSVMASLNEEGLWYLHVRSADNVDNLSSSVCYGPYEIIKLSIDDVKIEGYWNHWRGQVDKFGKLLDNHPHRFLSLEKVKITIKTTGAEKIVVRFSPELEAMQYIDKYGNVYDYYADFDLPYIRFPDDSTFYLDPSVPNQTTFWEYTLPLVDSSLGYDNIRYRPPYKLIVKAIRGSAEIEYIIDDIEITGNIMDQIFIQEVK